METRVSRIKIPTTGVFDFPKLIQEGKGKYVDKTALLYELCNDADAQLFISRPRRFGKSLMLSTLKAMIVSRIKAADEIPADLNGLVVSQIQLDVCDAETMPLEALLYQGGYLTIKRVRASGRIELGIPNNEISMSLTKEYGNPWLDTSLPVFYVGINYDPAKRGIDDPLVEAMS